jgi:hypothetical protein
MSSNVIIVLVGQGVVGVIVTIASAIIISRVGAVHTLVNNRSEQQDAKIAVLTAQLAAKGVRLTAAQEKVKTRARR